MIETANYIKALVTPQAKKANTSRRVWSIDLETVWLPFFTATNVTGDTAIPHDALGAPLRLGYNRDGTVKFSNSGRPVIRVVKDLSDSVRMIRDNFTAGLMAYASEVATENPNGFKAEIAKAHEAGVPIITRDNAMLKDAYARMMAEQVEAELKAKQKADRTTEPPADTEKASQPKRKVRKPIKAHADQPADNPPEPPENGNHAEPNTEPTKEPALVS